jgi:hypothetical protein
MRSSACCALVLPSRTSGRLHALVLVAERRSHRPARGAALEDDTALGFAPIDEPDVPGRQDAAQQQIEVCEDPRCGIGKGVAKLQGHANGTERFRDLDLHPHLQIM